MQISNILAMSNIMNFQCKLGCGTNEERWWFRVELFTLSPIREVLP
jgi:hypothetical protein